MRTFKFRVWAFARKAYFYPDYDDLNFKDGEIEVKPNTVIEQFTGLQDSKGRDIYEGDVCRFESNIERAIIFKDGAFGYEVCGDFISFGGHHYLTQILRFVEVIGNIHEKTLDNIEPSA